MARRVNRPSRRGTRRDRTVQEYQHDTYKQQGKPKEPTVCSGCGALFHRGRWTWGFAPIGAKSSTCPACHRARDKYPKGLVTITGNFKEEQREQVQGVIRNAEAREMKEHPLSRIMGIERRPEACDFDDGHAPPTADRRSSQACLSRRLGFSLRPR
jgi:NMD protein affecting ribosome stability and mRNA decay